MCARSMLSRVESGRGGLDRLATPSLGSLLEIVAMRTTSERLAEEAPSCKLGRNNIDYLVGPAFRSKVPVALQRAMRRRVLCIQPRTEKGSRSSRGRRGLKGTKEEVSASPRPTLVVPFPLESL